jgi:hypothetical protein
MHHMCYATQCCSRLKGRAAHVRRLFPKLTWSILDLVCPITRLQLLGLRHRRCQHRSISLALGVLTILPTAELGLRFYEACLQLIWTASLCFCSPWLCRFDPYTLQSSAHAANR